MISELIIIFSSHKEANSFLYQTKFKFNKLKPDYFLAKNSDFNLKVFISGIGKNAVSIFLKNCEITEEPFVIKAGTSAVLDPDKQLLKAYIPEKIYYENNCINIIDKNNIKNELNIMKNYINPQKLLTINFPLINGEKAEEIYKNGFSYIDMETYFFLDKMNETKIIPILVGTDRGDYNAKTDFFNNISSASEILKDAIIEFIEKA